MSTVTSSIEEINFRHGMFLSFTRGDIFAKYDLGKKLGSGGFSQVRHARNKDTGAMRAVKTIRKALIREDPTTREMFINEI
jgi:serine/threonine protein kinase